MIGTRGDGPSCCSIGCMSRQIDRSAIWIYDEIDACMSVSCPLAHGISYHRAKTVGIRCTVEISCSLTVSDWIPRILSLIVSLGAPAVLSWQHSGPIRHLVARHTTRRVWVAASSTSELAASSEQRQQPRCRSNAWSYQTSNRIEVCRYVDVAVRLLHAC